MTIDRGTANAVLDRELIGDSLPMVRLRALIARVAPSPLPVLIEGPTGSGKELVARTIHRLSGRRGPLIAFNVCAITDSMFEDALFGHVRGAFTGAVHESPGYLAQANEGTVFLDEINGLSLASQAKLLRAIETREFRPVGGQRDVRSDFRVVATTNRPLFELQEHGEFREDLRHRFGKLVIRVPALADRHEDIEQLARAFLFGANPRATISAAAIERLAGYDWPGNVRELRATVEAAAVLTEGTIGSDDVASLLGDSNRQQVRLDFAVRATIEAVARANGNVAAAARALGVNKTTVYRRLRRATLAARRPR